jgi:queuine tRNA-ribosyltransferase
VQLRNASNARSDRPVDDDCGCEVCRRHSRGYLRHLFQVGEPSAARLLTIHNLAWTFALVERLRVAIADGRLDDLRHQVLATWG